MNMTMMGGMGMTIMLAQILGIVFIVVGLALLINKKSAMALIEEASRNQGMMLLMGFISLTIGSVLVVLNNVWTSGLPSLVSLIGWLTLLKSIFVLIFPKGAASLYKKWNKGGMIIFAGIVVLIVGLVLAYKGF